MVSKFSLDVEEYQDIDPRLKLFLKGWKVIQNYKNQKVTIPGTWNSEIFPVKYFEVIKNPNDANYPGDESENEIGLTLWAGWKEKDNSGCYDHEVEINLFILGKDVKNKSHYKIGAEILKAGGADMTVFYDGKKVTDFTKTEYRKVWWNTEKIQITADKIWISNMKKYV